MHACYGLFRDYFLHLAKLFKAQGYILDLEDVFYFTFDEIKRIVNEGRLSSELSRKRDERKREIVEYENVELPEVIYGDEAPIPIRKEGKVRVFKWNPSLWWILHGNYLLSQWRSGFFQGFRRSRSSDSLLGCQLDPDFH